MINDAHDIVIRDSHIHDVPKPSWARRGSSRVQVVDSEIYQLGSPLIDAALRIYGIRDDFDGPAPDIGDEHQKLSRYPHAPE